MTVSDHLEQAVISLLQAKERAERFDWPAELIERIDLLKRATAKVRKQAEESHGEP